MTPDERDNLTSGELSAIRLLFHQMVQESNEDDLGVILKSGAWHHLDDDDGESVVRLADKLRASPEELDVITLARAKQLKKNLLLGGLLPDDAGTT